MEFENFTTLFADPNTDEWGLFRESGPTSGPASKQAFRAGSLQNRASGRRLPGSSSPEGLHAIRRIGSGGLADLAHNVRERIIHPVKSIEQRVSERRAKGIGLGQGGLLRIAGGIALGAAFGYAGGWAYSELPGIWSTVGGIGVGLAGYGTSKAIQSHMDEEAADQFGTWFGVGAGLGAGYYYRGTIERTIDKAIGEAKQYLNYLDLAWTIVSPGGRALVELAIDPEAVLTAPFRTPTP